MRERVHVNRTMKDLVADLRYNIMEYAIGEEFYSEENDS